MAAASISEAEADFHSAEIISNSSPPAITCIVSVLLKSARDAPSAISCTTLPEEIALTAPGVSVGVGVAVSVGVGVGVSPAFSSSCCSEDAGINCASPCSDCVCACSGIIVGSAVGVAVGVSAGVSVSAFAALSSILYVKEATLLFPVSFATAIALMVVVVFTSTGFEESKRVLFSVGSLPSVV